MTEIKIICEARILAISLKYDESTPYMKINIKRSSLLDQNKIVLFEKGVLKTNNVGTVIIYCICGLY